MHEILKHLSAGSMVLDLGCAQGSFPNESTLARTIRLDREVPDQTRMAGFVRGDAAKLPFAVESFAAVVANHTLEHFDELDAVLAEVRRVLSPDGALFVSVPDASTLTDKLYRWLAKGGGHVNPFTSGEELAARIEKATGLRHAGTRILYSSLSFLNSRNSPSPRPRRLMLVGGGTEWSLRLYVWLSRQLDKWFNTRTSVYGWALYFGGLNCAVDTEAWPNVCIRCGSGVSVSLIAGQSLIYRRFGAIQLYRCPYCDTVNPLVAE